MMDAPALPPSQVLLPSQSDVSALVSTVSSTGDDPSSRSELPAELQAASLGPIGLSTVQPLVAQPAQSTRLVDTFPKAMLSGVRALDFNLLARRNEASMRPAGWLSSSQLTRAFGFIRRVFRSAELDYSLQLSQFGPSLSPSFSAAVPIQWASHNHWQSWVKTADVQVNPVGAQGQLAGPSGESEAWAVPFVSECLVGGDRQLSEAPTYRLSLKGKTLGYVADRDQAYLLAQQLEQLLHSADFEADEIRPQSVSTQSADIQFASSAQPVEFRITAADQTLFSVDESMAAAVGYSPEWAAVAWANNLRIGLEAEPLKVGESQMALKGMASSEIKLSGEASWYGPYFHGRLTANGETYNQHDLTVAHKSLPFGTYLKVRNLLNDRTVVVRVNDRGPYVGDRSLDLSNAAAKCLGSEDTGVVPYEATILKPAALPPASSIQ
ncbi:MAG: septal ring lytic transglycosylase RlpA family protein [Cyanobacteria bacterium P01_D01_bin.105]